jgi:hypothetical protein
MNQQRDVRIRDQVQGFLGRRVGCHYYCRCGRIWAVGKVGVVHQGNVRKEIRASGKVKLRRWFSQSWRRGGR